MITANSTCTDKLRPLIIHKYQKPRCFGYFNSKTICDYYFNQKSWMKMAIFNDWLTHFNNKIKLCTPETQVLLLVDNASAHNVESQRLSNVTLQYLPPQYD